MRIEVILQVLEEAKARVARDAMETPAADMLTYGRIVGMYAGLDLAKTTLLEIHTEQDKRTNRL